MKNLFNTSVLFLLLALFGSNTFSQPVTNETIKRVSVLPSTCSPTAAGGAVIRKTTNSAEVPRGIYECTATNTWTRIIPGASGTVNNITNNVSITGGNLAAVSGYASLPAALAAMGSTPITLLLDTDKTVSANATIPANIDFQAVNGAKLTVPTGVTVTILGSFAAPPVQVFNLSGTGKVDLSKSVSRAVFPEWWGAKGQDLIDDHAAITQAIKALGESSEARSGRIIFKDFGYRFGSQINLNQVDNLIIEGTESQWNGGRVTLTFTGTGNLPAISIAQSRGLTMQFLRINHSDTTYTGDFIKAGDTLGYGDTFHFTMISSAIVGNYTVGSSFPRSLLNIDTTIISEVRLSNFIGGQHNIIGRETGHSINNQFYGNSFKHSTVAAVKSVGETWTMVGNGFHSGVAIIPGAPEYYSQGFFFANNYFESAGGELNPPVGRTWITMKVLGGTFTGQKFPHSGNAGRILDFVAGSAGISISGNRFEDNIGNNTAIYASGATSGVSITGNNFQGGAPIGGDLLYSASGNSGLADRADNFTAAGGLVPSNAIGVDFGYRTSIRGENTSAQIGLVDASTGLPNRALVIQSSSSNGGTISFLTQGIESLTFTDASMTTTTAAINFTASDYSAATGLFTHANHNLTDRMPVVLTGSVPAPFALNTKYYIYVLSSSTFKIAESTGAVNNGIGLVPTTGGSGMITPVVGTINLPGHGLTTGKTVTFSNSGGALPTGLATGRQYYAIRYDANYIGVATTAERASANISQPITAASGGGTHSLLVPVGIERARIDGYGTSIKNRLLFDTDNMHDIGESKTTFRPRNIFAASNIITTGGDVFVNDATKGMILKSPDGTCYRYTAANGGGLNAGVSVACP